MKCKQVCHYICDNLDADIDSPRCRQIKRHLEACPDCAAYLDSLKKTVLLYRNVPAPTVPLSVHRRLIKAINVVWAIPAAIRIHAAKGRAH